FAPLERPDGFDRGRRRVRDIPLRDSRPCVPGQPQDIHADRLFAVAMRKAGRGISAGAAMTREVDIPDGLRRLMAEIGPAWAATGNVGKNIDLMTEEFAKVLALAPKDNVLVQPDIAYGDHPRQRLDVYSPANV